MRIALPFFSAALVTLLFLSNGAIPAAAGPNANGVLIVHESGPWYSHIYDYCDFGAVPATCAEADTRVDSPGYEIRIWKVYAAFPDGAAPRLRGLTFGVAHPAEEQSFFILGWGMCGDFEIPDFTWPSDGSGVGMTWQVAQTSSLVECYWFAGYNYYEEPALFAVIPHPIQGGWFGDDSVPSVLDPIAAYGALGFYREGLLPCPSGASGACCLPDGTCVFTTLEDCTATGGSYLGAGVSCDPDPCQPIPVLDSSWGRVKARYR